MPAQNITLHSDLLHEYRVIFLWDNNELDHADNSTLDWMIKIMRLGDQYLISRLVRDEENPDYIIATNKCYGSVKALRQLKHYFKTRPNSIFIYFTYELFETDLNIFDYGFSWNPDLKCGDRIGRHFTYMYDLDNNSPCTNNLTREQAQSILDGGAKFCNFIYSHAVDIRDNFFHLLSKYKRVDSFGRHLNNMFRPSREASNWYDLSIQLKKGYKFSIAFDNAVYKGYTTEKIVSSLCAHTVPIYWGDPIVTDFINPKAFINCNDYASFEEVIERVKEIDNNDELWLDIVTQPWQTEEQRAKTIQAVEDYNSFVRNIFSQDIRTAVRRPIGSWGDSYRKSFTGSIGMIAPFYVRLARMIAWNVKKVRNIGLRASVKKIMWRIGRIMRRYLSTNHD